MMWIIDIAAVGGAMIGAFLIAANIGKARLGYVFFLISSIASVILVLNSNVSNSLLVTNAFFIGMNLLGLARHK
jgi:hypothetical protein